MAERRAERSELSTREARGSTIELVEMRSILYGTIQVSPWDDGSRKYVLAQTRCASMQKFRSVLSRVCRPSHNLRLMPLALAQPEHEIVIVQTPEELQQCYNVVSLIHSYALNKF